MDEMKFQGTVLLGRIRLSFIGVVWFSLNR